MQQALEELRTQLSEAQRTQAKPLKEKILALERKKDEYANELAQFEAQIKKKHQKIAALNEKTYKASIKTTVLGKDCAKSEYWHFKDDSTRLYIRMEEEVGPTKEPDVDLVPGADAHMDGEVRGEDE